MFKEVNLPLPAPHPAQQRVINESKRYNVLACGRRWGKTLLGIDRLIHVALQGKPVAWFAPNYRLLSDVWRELAVLLSPVIERLNQQERRIDLFGGGSIDMWSLDGPDAARGRAYALVVIDEAAMIPNLEQAWLFSIRPTLTDMVGQAWFLSTPKGMNYFKVLFDRGQEGEKLWASWQMPTAENPCIDRQEIESARLDLTEAAFNQEYLALFLNWEGSVFRRVTEAAIIAPGMTRDASHHYVIGCDWGRARDYTAFLVLDLHARAVVELHRSNHVDYALQCERLKALTEKWQPLQIIAEQNSIGQPIIEQLQRDGLTIQPFVTSHASKTQAIESLALAFERSDIQILNDPVLVSELVAYQAEPLPSGQLRYGAPSGQHDDTVMALAMAWTAVSAQQFLVFPIPESKLVVPDFQIPAHWPRAFAVDIKWGRIAAMWGAHDPESDVLYLCREYCEDAEPATQVAAIRSHGDWIPGLMDPTAHGRERSDGGGLMQTFRSLGLQLQSNDNAFESGILNLRERMQSGRLKVFASLSKYLEEYRCYRRNDVGQIVNQNHALQDAARCLVNGLSRFRTKPKPKMLRRPLPDCSGPQAWMG